jgi:hypothetical protein
VLAAAKVSVELPLPGAVMLVGEKVPVTPVGSPETVRATAELKVELPAVVKLRLPFPNGPIVSAVAELFRVKDGASTVSVKLEVWVSDPAVAVTLTV